MRLKFIFLALLYFPGTVLHEMSHYVVAKLLFVRTGKVSLLPRFTENGIVLGSVEVGKTDFIRHFLIGIAPLLVGVLGLSSCLYIVLTISLLWWQYVLVGYIVLTVLNTMTLSKSDLQEAWKIGLLLALAIIVLIALH